MSRRRFSQEYLIEALQALAERLGRAPKERDTYKYRDVPTHQVYVNRFGSWREALQAAGSPLNPRNMGYDREGLLEHLRELAERVGRTPLHADLEKIDGPASKTYVNHLGSWAAALEEAGLEQEPASRRYARPEVLEILREVADELGHAPSMAELWEREELPSPSTYKYRFGRWNDALREAGLTPRHPMKRRDGGCDGDAGSNGHEQCVL